MLQAGIAAPMATLGRTCLGELRRPAALVRHAVPAQHAGRASAAFCDRSSPWLEAQRESPPVRPVPGAAGELAPRLGGLEAAA